MADGKEKVTITDPELKALQDAERERLETEVAAAMAQREAKDAQEVADLKRAQAMETSALDSYNQMQFKNQGEIISAAETKINEAKQKDETARRRENAFRYISGLGDTLSSVANLVGTAHGAENQQQTYNSHAVVAKAEEARKARKIELDDLSKRLDEMRTRQRDLQAAGSLKEAELKAKQAKESAALAASQRKSADEAKKYADSQTYRAVRDIADDWHKNKNFEEGKRQFSENQRRLAADAAASRQLQRELAEARLAADEAKERAKNAKDPKHQAQTLQSNITGVRDELARKMGYADYNEYLRYKNVSGWGEDIEGKRNRESIRIRDERASKNPETEEFLNLLRSPESMTEEQVRMLMSASNVFADAVNAAEKEEEPNKYNKYIRK